MGAVPRWAQCRWLNSIQTLDHEESLWRADLVRQEGCVKCHTVRYPAREIATE